MFIKSILIFIYTGTVRRPARWATSVIDSYLRSVIVYAFADPGCYLVWISKIYSYVAVFLICSMLQSFQGILQRLSVTCHKGYGCTKLRHKLVSFEADALACAADNRVFSN